MTTWITIDPANTSGWALWQGANLWKSGAIRAKGKSGKWVIEGQDLSDAVCASEYEAWTTLLTIPDYLVLEHGRGMRRNADARLGERRGYIRAVADANKCRYNEITNAEWRRIVREVTGLSWPTGESKSHAQRIVRDIYGIEAGSDESDALLIGMAWIKSGRN
jgi:hypothetical protein